MRQALGPIVLLLAMASGASGADDRPRLLVLTDIGGDPDDQQSLIRLLLYSNEFQIEGLIASASGTPGELKETVTRADLIRATVEAYGKVQPNLVRHAPDYPAADVLLAQIKAGNPRRGLAQIGEGRDTEGSQWIIRTADSVDARPLNISIWGGQTDLAQALWRVRQDRSADALKAFLARLRIYDIDDQDRLQPWIFENFPDLLYVLAKAPPDRDKREGAYRGIYLGGDESLTSLAWLDEHVRQNHGPLGALYPAKTWTAPNPHSALKEGDTPSWFYFRPSALQDPAHPEWGGLGGRFQRAERGLWRDAADAVAEKIDPRATVWRWRPAFQRDFQARLDWCVKDPAGANHPPQLLSGGVLVQQPIVRRAAAGKPATVGLSARDPDGDALRYQWWAYAEAGSFAGTVSLQNETTPVVTVDLPAAAAGQTLHLILEVTDGGSPPLTAFARTVLTVE
jgi:hypothetical protein